MVLLPFIELKFIKVRLESSKSGSSFCFCALQGRGGSTLSLQMTNRTTYLAPMCRVQELHSKSWLLLISLPRVHIIIASTMRMVVSKGNKNSELKQRILDFVNPFCIYLLAIIVLFFFF